MHFSLCIVNLLVLKNSDFQETKALREGLHVFDFNVEFFEQKGGQLQYLSSKASVFHSVNSAFEISRTVDRI